MVVILGGAGGRSLSILRAIKSRARKRGEKSESKESCFSAFSLGSPSGNFPLSTAEGIKQACSHPETQSRGRAGSSYLGYRQAPGSSHSSGTSSAPLPVALARQPNPGAGDITHPFPTSAQSSWRETEARKLTGFWSVVSVPDFLHKPQIKGKCNNPDVMLFPKQ